MMGPKRLGRACLLAGALAAGLPSAEAKVQIETAAKGTFVERDTILNPSNYLGLVDSVAAQLWLRVDLSGDLIADRLTYRLADSAGFFPGNAGSYATNRLLELGLSLRITDHLFFDLGKFVAKNSPGFFKQPSDFLSPGPVDVARKMQNELLEEEGAVQARIQAYLGAWVLNLHYAPRLVWPAEADVVMAHLSSPQSNHQALARLSRTIAGADLCASAYYGEGFKAGFTAARVFGESLEIHLDGILEERVNAMGLREIVVTRAVPGPGGTTTLEIGRTHALEEVMDAWRPSLLLGGHLTLPGQWNIMAEYFYNGRGLAADAWTSALALADSNATRLSAGNPLAPAALGSFRDFLFNRGFTGLAQHYGMLRMGKEFKSGFAIELAAILNLVDGSGLLLSETGFKKEDAAVSLLLSAPFGPRRSEFALIPKRFDLSLSLQLFL
jgi:hypothetical protein